MAGPITPEYKCLIDPAVSPADGVQYVGLAQPNTATSDALWSLMRLTFSSSELAALEWADGTNQFLNIWDTRAGYTYS